MIPPPDKREEWIFREAQGRPAAERAVFLDGACAGDAALRERLERLFAAQDQPEEVLADGIDVATVKATIKLDLADAPDEAVGQTLGRYKLLERIGEGGCGVVYVAEQTEPVRRRVALKVIKLGMDTKQVVARFEAERQALAMMDHPNIAKVLEAGTTDVGRPFFVMELVRGIRITDYCDRANLTTKERLDLFIQVCQAIQHAHQKGIIHRDIKPSNILVSLHDDVPVPKVIDFGIAKAVGARLTDKTVYTAMEQFMGTPAYMSPEQAGRSDLDIDTRSDIYALGVLLYELLTGRPPFDPKQLAEAGLEDMVRCIREEEPLPPSTRLSRLQGEELTTTAQRRGTEPPKLIHLLRGDLDWIVMKCLEKNRTRRYEAANALAQDIERHLNHEPITARPPNTAYRVEKFVRRNKVVVAAGAAVAVALVAGIGASTWQTFVARQAQRDAEAARNGEQRQRLEAQSAQKAAETEQQRADAQARKASESQQQSRRLLYAADMNLAQQALKLNNLGKARRLLDRHRPQSGEEDLRGWEWRYLWQLTRSSALVTLTNRPAIGFSASFSPDGTRLAVGWYDGRVDLWDVPDRRWVRALTDREYPHPGRVAFSPVRNLLAATSEPNVVALYDLDSGQESTLWREPDQGERHVRDLAFSPDGSRIVIYAGSTRKIGDQVWVVNVSSTQIESRQPSVLGSDEFHGAARLSPDHRRLYLARSDVLKKRYRICCIDPATGQELWQTEPQRDRGLSTLDLSPDGRVLAAGSGYEDPTIHVWEAATGRPLGRLEGHTGWVCRLAFSRDGRRLVSAASDQTIRFWDTSNWTETQVLRGHTDEVHGVAISERAHLIASVSKNGELLLWKEDEQSAADGYRRLPESLLVNAVLPLDQSRLLLLPSGLPPQIVDLRRDSPPEALPEIGSSTNILGWFGTNVLCHWNGTNQIMVRELRGAEFVQSGAVRVDFATRPTGFAYNVPLQLLAWTEGISSTSVHLASLAAPDRRIELRSEVPGLVPSFFSEDGNFLAAVRGDLLTVGADSLRVWNVQTGRIVASIDESILDATLAAGGRVLIASVAQHNDHEIRFYDLANPERPSRRVPGRHSSMVLAVSPDGGLVASSTIGGLVCLFDPAKGELIESVQGQLNAAFGIAFSPDGRRLISASCGREAIKLWDVGTLQELLTLAGTGSILGVARWSADGNVLLAGAPWQAWRAPSWEEITAAESKDLPAPGSGGQGKAERKQP